MAKRDIKMTNFIDWEQCSDTPVDRHPRWRPWTRKEILADCTKSFSEIAEELAREELMARGLRIEKIIMSVAELKP